MIYIQEIPFGSELYEKSLRFRENILRKPLGLLLSFDDIQNEISQIHIVAIEDDKIKGTVLLYPQLNNIIKLRQMAIDPVLQGRGYGKKLIEFAESKARILNAKSIEMTARVRARNFYETMGYQVRGREYLELTIPHISMVKFLNNDT